MFYLYTELSMIRYLFATKEPGSLKYCAHVYSMKSVACMSIVNIIVDVYRPAFEIKRSADTRKQHVSALQHHRAFERNQVVFTVQAQAFSGGAKTVALTDFEPALLYSLALCVAGVVVAASVLPDPLDG